MLDQLLGEEAEHIFAIQVRIYISNMGIFKGVLTEKPGIDKIELPSSMNKVKPSASRTDNRAILMINKSGKYPYASRIERQQQNFTDEKRFPDMARWMMIQKGVSNSYLMQNNPHHDTVKGLVDPTDSLPSGCIFLTGIQGHYDLFGEKVLVSRYPMIEASDGVLIPLVKEKPATMTDAQWDFLQSKPFGAVYFGKPSPGERALSEYIAQGDCDGDDYFVCWDQKIVADALIGDIPKLATKKSTSRSSASTVMEWWLQTQEYMMDVESKKDSSRLIGCLNFMWQKGLREGRLQEALVFGRASKEAIDITKHGGKVDLPENLWKHIPYNLHVYLRRPQG